MLELSYSYPYHFENIRSELFQEYEGCLRMPDEFLNGKSYKEKFVISKFCRGHVISISSFPIRLFNHMKRDFLNEHI